MTNHKTVNKLDAALEYARRGWPVFPCLPDAKEPATKHGFHDATCDEQQIRAWWSANPDYNLAFCPHTVGLAVIDPDGDEGIDNWVALGEEHGEPPETYAVQTPRGGLHLYYRGEVPPSQSILAPHVDTRGRGSYALLPPSTFEGKPYVALNNLVPAELPSFVPALLAAAKKDRVKAQTNADLDQPQNVARAAEYLKRAAPAIEGQMGDKQTFVTACQVLEFGVSPELTHALMVEHWNPRCDPPWDEEELEVKIQNASSYAQNEIGAWAVQPAAEVFSAVLGKLLEESKSSQPAGQSPFRPMLVSELLNRPKLPFLLPELLPARCVAMLYAPPDSFKSFLTVDMAMRVAQEKEVLYIAGEDDEGIGERINAWCVARGLGPDDHKLRVVGKAPWADHKEQLAEFEAEILGAGMRPAMVVIDTASKMLGGLDESHARDANAFVHVLEEMKRAFNCAVLVVHHTGKDASRGARGSNALLGGMDVMLEVEGDHGSKTAALYVRKMKGAKRRTVPWCYELKELAGSLVPFEISMDDRRARTTRDDLLTPGNVGQALSQMGAAGEANGVSAHALAMHLIQHGTDVPSDPEALQARAGEMAAALGRRAKGQLRGFTYGGDYGAPMWALPVTAPAP